MSTRLTPIAGSMMCALILSACGGGGGDSNPGTPGATTPAPAPAPVPTPAPAPAPATGFTAKASWAFTPPARGSSICFDFDTNAQTADCTGTAWDVKATGAGSSVTLWTNSGTSGTGTGGAFGSPFEHTWADLLTWANGTTDPVSGAIPAQLYFADSARSVFTGSNSIATAAFEYGLGGANDHLLYPSYRVFLVTTDAAQADAVGGAGHRVFAVQLVGYYGGASGTTSGNPTLRWIDRTAPANVRTASVNATAGWVYFDLVAGAVSTETGTWHIALNRYNVKLNSGTSGTGNVGGFLARTPTGFYDAEGNPIAASLRAATPDSTLGDLTTGPLSTPATASAWVKDSLASSLNPEFQGSYPNALDFGWYVYYPTSAAATAAGLPAVAHLISARPDRGTLVRSGTGGSYARMQLASIVYADPLVATSAQTWTINFDVQPAP